MPKRGKDVIKVQIKIGKEWVTFTTGQAKRIYEQLKELFEKNLLEVTTTEGKFI